MSSQGRQGAVRPLRMPSFSQVGFVILRAAAILSNVSKALKNENEMFTYSVPFDIKHLGKKHTSLMLLKAANSQQPATASLTGPDFKKSYQGQ